MSLHDRLDEVREDFWRVRRRLRDARKNGQDALKKRLAKHLDRLRRLKDRLLEKIANRPPKYGSAPGAPDWGGCRQVTDEIVRIVGNRAPVTSRKRTETFGNPGSDHHVSQTTADAVDFGIANAHGLADEVGQKLGIGSVSDYGNYYLTRNGLRFRVQPISGTHGTGPHMHWGVRRA